MEFDSVIRGRRSIRKFTPEPVRPELVREILDEARWSPSWANTQAWNICVVTGRDPGAAEGRQQAADPARDPYRARLPHAPWVAATPCRAHEAAHRPAFGLRGTFTPIYAAVR